MTNEQKNIEKQFNGLFMDLDLTDEQAEKITYLKRYVLEALRIHDVSNRRELLCAFFKYFRDNGEANIGMTIEEFVDGFLSTQRSSVAVSSGI